MDTKKSKAGRPAKNRYAGYEYLMRVAHNLRERVKSDMDVYEDSVNEATEVSRMFGELNMILPDKNSRILSDNASSRLYFADVFYAQIMRDEYRYMLQGIDRLIAYLEVCTPQKYEEQDPETEDGKEAEA